MKPFSYLLSLTILFLFASCSHTTENKSEIAGRGVNASLEMVDQDTEKPEAQSETDRKLTKEGYVEFETEDLTAARETVIEAVEKHNGYVSSDQEFKQRGRIKNELVLRVPAESFDKLLSDATEGVDKFDRKEIEVKDVTEEFLDIEARLKTKKELEKRYLALLEKAKNVSEILEIERELGKVRSQIESTEGRLKYLQDRVSYSIITMTFYEDIPSETAFGQKFKNGFNQGWDNLVWFFVLLTHIWPFLLIGVGFIVGIKVYSRKKKRSK